MSANLLFGVPPNIYQNPFGAAAALRLAPFNGMGADLVAVGESIQADSQRTGDAFIDAVDHYQTALRNKDKSESQTQKWRLADLLRGMSQGEWSRVVTRLPGWAVGGGLFATQPFAFRREQLKQVGETEIIKPIWEPYRNYPAIRDFFPLFFGEEVTPLATDEGAVEFLKRFEEEVGEENSAKAFANFPEILFLRGLWRSGCDQLASRYEKSTGSDDEKLQIKNIEDDLSRTGGTILQMPEFLLELAKITGPHVGEAFNALNPLVFNPNFWGSKHFLKFLLELAEKTGPRVGEVFLILSEMPSGKLKSVDGILGHLESMEQERLKAEAAEAIALEENPPKEGLSFNETELRGKSDQELENMIEYMAGKGREQLFDSAMTSYYDHFAPEYFPVLEELRRRGKHSRIASLLTSHPLVSQHHSWSRGTLTAYSFCRPCKRTIYEFIRNHFDEFKTDAGVLTFFERNNSDRSEEEMLELLAQQGAWKSLDEVRCDSGREQSKRHMARDILDREIDRIEISEILLTIGAFGANVESRLKAVAKLEALGRTRAGSRRNLDSIATGDGMGQGWTWYKNDTVIAAAKAALEQLSQEGGNHE